MRQSRHSPHLTYLISFCNNTATSQSTALGSYVHSDLRPPTKIGMYATSNPASVRDLGAHSRFPVPKQVFKNFIATAHAASHRSRSRSGAYIVPVHHPAKLITATSSKDMQIYQTQQQPVLHQTIRKPIRIHLIGQESIWQPSTEDFFPHETTFSRSENRKRV
jgi:hypothetical protein